MHGLAITQLAETLRVHGNTVEGIEGVLKDLFDRVEYYSSNQIRYSIDMVASHIVRSYLDGNVCLLKDPMMFFLYVEMCTEKYLPSNRHSIMSPEWGSSVVMDKGLMSYYNGLKDDAITKFSLELVSRGVFPTQLMMNHHLDSSVHDFVEL